MEWDFSAEEVVKGEIDYKLENFREDFYDEVSNNMGQLDPEQLFQCYSMLYDLSYWCATGKDFDEFLDAIAASDAAKDPVLGEQIFLDRGFLMQAKEFLGPNIEMLGAILQRMIMDGVEQGMPLEQALEQATKRHGDIVAKSPRLN